MTVETSAVSKARYLLNNIEQALVNTVLIHITELRWNKIALHSMLVGSQSPLKMAQILLE
jgi:hypothetical protein